MAKFLEDKDLDEILAETSASIYFFQREKESDKAEFKVLYEDDGSVIVEFTTAIAKVEPVSSSISINL